MRKTAFRFSLLLVALPLALPAQADDRNGQLTGEAAVQAVEGLWAYDTLTSPGGEPRELTGFIFFGDGLFAQQSIFDEEPFEAQMAMAHAGTCDATPQGVHLVAEQTVSIFPEKEEPLSFRRDTQHDLAVSRSGDRMTLVFGSGTVQTFERIGDGAGEIHRLQHGLLALVDGYLLLVDATEKGVTSGYGTFEKNGDAYDVAIVRWAETDGSRVSYRRDGTLRITFDGDRVRLPDGRSFAVRPSGTEPKIKYYMFARQMPAEGARLSPEELAAAKTRVRASLDALWTWLERDIESRLA
jgi:hypothetical protein